MRLACAALIGVLGLGIESAWAGPIKTSPSTFQDHPETVAGACDYYRSTLMTGVSDSKGGTHAGRCRYSELQPLFDGKSLDDYWTAVVHGTVHPLHVVPAKGPGAGTCATATIVTLTLSANVEASRLDWQNGPAGGPGVQGICSTEWQRVNPLPTINSGLLQTRADAAVARVVHGLAPAPSFTACTISRLPGDLQRAIEVKFKATLQAIADRERKAWSQFELSQDDPGVGAANRCMPQCNVCAATGWVGTITCKKSVSGPLSYHHDETQTWFVGGGPPPNPTGQTLYPTAWTATGSGGKSAGTVPQTWHVNATGAGQLAIFPGTGVTNFQRSNAQITVFNGIQGSPTSYTAFEYQFLPFSSTDPHNAKDNRTDTGQPCDTPVTPGGSTCTVQCSWDLTWP